MIDELFFTRVLEFSQKLKANAMITHCTSEFFLSLVQKFAKNLSVKLSCQDGGSIFFVFFV